METPGTFSEKAWVAVGDEANWERGLENGIWGIIPKHKNHWDRVEPGDLVLFYGVAPIKGFFGAGIIRHKLIQTIPYWKEEVHENRVIWPYRFEFDVTHLIPMGSWQKLSVPNTYYKLAVLAGLNPVRDLSKALQVLDALKFTVVEPTIPEREIAATIFEIGKIQRMMVESNVAVDGDYLDVIWKRTIRSVPTFAFSVNLSDDFDRSIKPLKHSFDLWNSRPFLITDEPRVREVKDLSAGLYHEFSESLKILTAAQVQDLYDSKKRYYDLEEKYGLR